MVNNKLSKAVRDELTELAAEAKAAGISAISLCYSGSEDSGEFYESDSFSTSGKPLPDNVRERLTRVCEDLLEELHAGWEINDGAAGRFTFTVDTCELELEHNEYFKSTETTEHKFE